MTPVVVTWDDAHASMGQVDPHDIDHSGKVTYTIGWLVREDDAGVTVAMDFYEVGDCVHTTTFIPSGIILDITRLRRKKKVSD